MALLLALLLVAARFLDWNLFKGDIAAALGRRLGAPVEITGGMDVDFGRILRLQLHGLTIPSPSPAREPLLRVGALRVGVPVRTLLRGNVVVHDLELSDPRVLVTRAADGTLNWSALRSDDKGTATLPVIENLRVRGGTITYRDADLSDDVRIAVDRVTGSAARDGTVSFAGDGTIDGRRLNARVRADRDAGAAWQVDATATIADTRLSVNGRLSAPDLHVALRTPDLAQLNFLPLLQLPHVKDVRFTTRVTRDGGQWWLDNLDLRAGRRRLDGDIRVDLDRDPRTLYATLYLNELRLPEPARKSHATQLIPAIPIDLSPLRAVNGRVRLRIGRVTNTPLAVRDVRLTASLRHGKLTVSPFSASLGKGSAQGELILDGAETKPSARLHLALRGLHVRSLLPPAASKAVQADISGRIDVAARGKNLKQLLASADGEIIFLIRDGAIQSRWLEAVRLDLAEWLLLQGRSRSNETPIRCGFAAFAVNDGVLLPRPVVIDTRDSWLTANGFIDLEHETLQLTIRSHPKDFSPFSGQAPITVVGPLRNPSIDIPTDRLLGRGAAALALGTLLSPIAGLIPFIEPGLATDRDCQELLAGVPLGGSSASR